MTPRDLRKQWELAGMVAEDGSPYRPFASDELLVPPRIELSGDDLVWYRYARKRRWRSVQPQREMLERFMQLAEADGTEILGYARRWGVLRICKHGLPASHNPARLPFDLERCDPTGNDESGFREPLKLWRYFARQVRAIVNITASLHEGSPGKPEDWQVVYERGDWMFPPVKIAPGKVLFGFESAQLGGIREQRSRVATVVNEWLMAGNVQPRLAWRHGHSPALLVGERLFGTLAVQLLAAVTRTRGYVICSGCGVPYQPKRQTRPGQRHYCGRCGRAAAERDASRAYRRRKRLGNEADH